MTEPVLAAAPDPALGALFQPRHCTLRLSPDRSQVALTFGFTDQAPLVVVLPIDGLVGLQRRMAEGLLQMGTLPVQAGPMETDAPESTVAPESEVAAAAVA